ncbi:beta-1,3-galactosyl-O-glycosyl-glycoprotein beta-1,6-N-acetylglucosaminyltransferase 4-like [Arapaima gigas]
MRMKISCTSLHKVKHKCLVFSIPIMTVWLLKSFVICKRETVKNAVLAEAYEDRTNTSISPPFKLDVDCSLIYQLDPVEVGKSLEIRSKKTADLEDAVVVSWTSDCYKYIKQRGYAHIPVSDEEKQFPIAYSIVVHKHASMVERILRAIYMPHNVYCLHYDQKASKTFAAAIQNLAKCFSNVFVASKLETVQYAHISRLNADLNCLSDLLESEVPWRYVINLCGQDFPLRSNFELVTELKKLQGANMLESSRPSELKKQRFTFSYELKHISFEYGQLPIKTAQAKAPPPHSIEVFTGSAYFILSRQFVNHINGSQLAQDLLTWSADTYSPDEHFWATLVRVPGVPGEIPRSQPDVTDLMSKTRLVKWSYLEGLLYPPCTGTHVRSVCIYGATELRWLLEYGHWFANKFDSRVDPVLINCLEQKLEENQQYWVNTVSGKTLEVELKHSGSQ